MKTEEEINKIVAAIGPKGVAVAAVIGMVGVLILTGRYLYIRMTDIPKYDREELVSYGKLVDLYRKHMHVAEIPLEWVLDNDRPTYDYDLGNSASTLTNGLEDIKIAHPSIQFAAQGMLSNIIKLLNSVSKRWKGKIRRGSVEGMFFVELAHWVVQELQLIDFRSETGLEQLREMKLYCESVLAEILTPESNAYRNHPIGTLGTVIQDLTGILIATEHLIKSLTFHDHIVLLDNAILHMAAQSFHVMKLMINGDHEYQHDLSVALFLDKEQLHRQDITDFKKQRFASWLEQTLRKADIRCNDFIHYNNSLTCQEIDMHLQGECIRDDECLLPAKLISPDDQKWGHWDCIIQAIEVNVSAAVEEIATQEALTRTNKNKMKKDRYQAELQCIQINWRDVFRDILKLYRLREHLSNARTIAPIYGENWLYGDQVGLAMVVVLMNDAEIFTHKIYDSLRWAWERHNTIYDALRRTSHIRESDLAYTALRATEKKFKDFEVSYRMAADEIKGIRTASANHMHTRAKAQECKNQLLRGLVADLIYHGKENEPEYPILKQELLKLNVTLSGAPELLPLGRNTHVALAEEASPELMVITRAEAAGVLPLAVTIPVYPTPIVNHDELPIFNTTTDQLLGEPMPALQPTTEQFVYTSDQLRIAYEIQQIFNSPSVASEKHLKAPVLHDFCDDFHRKIYQNILAPFQVRAENRFISLCCFYSTAEWELLKLHQSRFNHALYVITEKLLPLKKGHDRDNYELQLSVINTCLLGNLFRMCQEINWHKAAAKLYFTDKALSHPIASEASPLNELENGCLEIVSDAARVILANARADRADIATSVARAETRVARAETSVARAETSVARAETSAARAETRIAREAAERSAQAAESSNAALQKTLQMVPKKLRKQFDTEDEAAPSMDLALPATTSLRF